MNRAVDARLADFAVDALAIGIIATDRLLRLHYANAAAERLLNDPSGVLRSMNGFLWTHDPARSCALKGIIDCVCAPNADLAEEQNLLMIPAVAPLLDVALRVVALGTAPDARPGQPTVMLFARSIERDCDLRLEARLMFGLTEMEAKFASAIASGLSLAGAAHAHNVQLSTARWHLKHIFEKTGTKQQSQVAALLRGAQIPLVRRSGSPPDPIVTCAGRDRLGPSLRYAGMDADR